MCEPYDVAVYEIYDWVFALYLDYMRLLLSGSVRLRLRQLCVLKWTLDVDLFDFIVCGLMCDDFNLMMLDIECMV